MKSVEQRHSRRIGVPATGGFGLASPLLGVLVLRPHYWGLSPLLGVVPATGGFAFWVYTAVVVFVCVKTHEPINERGDASCLPSDDQFIDTDEFSIGVAGCLPSGEEEHYQGRNHYSVHRDVYNLVSRVDEAEANLVEGNDLLHLRPIATYYKSGRELETMKRMIMMMPRNACLSSPVR